MTAMCSAVHCPGASSAASTSAPNAPCSVQQAFCCRSSLPMARQASLPRPVRGAVTMHEPRRGSASIMLYAAQAVSLFSTGFHKPTRILLRHIIRSAHRPSSAPYRSSVFTNRTLPVLRARKSGVEERYTLFKSTPAFAIGRTITATLGSTFIAAMLQGSHKDGSCTVFEQQVDLPRNGHCMQPSRAEWSAIRHPLDSS